MRDRMPRECPTCGRACQDDEGNTLTCECDIRFVTWGREEAFRLYVETLRNAPKLKRPICEEDH